MRPRIFPFILIGVGTVALLANLGVLPAEVIREAVSMGWPLVLIAVGVVALFGRHGHCHRHRDARRCAQSSVSDVAPETVAK